MKAGKKVEGLLCVESADFISPHVSLVGITLRPGDCRVRVAALAASSGSRC